MHLNNLTREYWPERKCFSLLLNILWLRLSVDYAVTDFDGKISVNKNGILFSTLRLETFTLNSILFVESVRSVQQMWSMENTVLPPGGWVVLSVTGLQLKEEGCSLSVRRKRMFHCLLGTLPLADLYHKIEENNQVKVNNSHAKVTCNA